MGCCISKANKQNSENPPDNDYVVATNEPKASKRSSDLTAEEPGVQKAISQNVTPPRPELDLKVEEPEQPVVDEEVGETSPSEQVITKWGVLLEEAEQPTHPLNLLPDDWASEQALELDEARMEELKWMEYEELKVLEAEQSQEEQLTKEEWMLADHQRRKENKFEEELDEHQNKTAAREQDAISKDNNSETVLKGDKCDIEQKNKSVKSGPQVAPLTEETHLVVENVQCDQQKIIEQPTSEHTQNSHLCEKDGQVTNKSSNNDIVAEKEKIEKFTKKNVTAKTKPFNARESQLEEEKLASIKENSLAAKQNVEEKVPLTQVSSPQASSSAEKEVSVDVNDKKTPLEKLNIEEVRERPNKADCSEEVHESNEKPNESSKEPICLETSSDHTMEKENIEEVQERSDEEYRSEKEDDVDEKPHELSEKTICLESQSDIAKSSLINEEDSIDLAEPILANNLVENDHIIAEKQPNQDEEDGPVETPVQNNTSLEKQSISHSELTNIEKAPLAEEEQMTEVPIAKKLSIKKCSIDDGKPLSRKEQAKIVKTSTVQVLEGTQVSDSSLAVLPEMDFESKSTLNEAIEEKTELELPVTSPSVEQESQKTAVMKCKSLPNILEPETGFKLLARSQSVQTDAIKTKRKIISLLISSSNWAENYNGKVLNTK